MGRLFRIDYPAGASPPILRRTVRNIMIPFPSDPGQEIAFDVEQLRSVLEQMLVQKTVFQFDATTAVQRMLDADVYGIPSHGVGRIGESLDAIDAGEVDPRGRVLTMNEADSFAVLDGSRALGQIAATQGMQTAVAKARESGIGLALVGSSQSLGAASVYARLAADDGLIGVCLTSTDRASLAVPGTNCGAVGNSAFAYAIPCDGSHPLVFDSACGAESWGKLDLLRRYGIPFPDDLVFNSDGPPATNDRHAEVQRPAGALGFGLSLFCSVLAGPLCGGRMPIHKTRGRSAEDSQHVCLALEIDRFTDRERFQGELLSTLEDIRALPPTNPRVPVRLPGDRGAALASQVADQGIRLHHSVAKDIQSRAAALGIDVNRDQTRFP